MDVNATLAELLDMVNTQLYGEAGFDVDDMERALELVEALDGWITKGGGLPDRWLNSGE